MALDSLTTVGTQNALRGVGDLQPYLMLLRSAPADPEAPTSAELVAAEVTMTSYIRMRITAWNWVPTGIPKAYIENQFQLEIPGALAGTVQTVTHYALVTTASGATGTVYAVGTVTPNVTLVVGKQIMIPAGYVRISDRVATDAEMDATIVTLEGEISDLNDQLDANTAALTAANDTITDLTADITALEVRIAALE